jgi:hypothetical protein
MPESGWSRYLAWIRKIAKSDNAQPGIDAEMLGYVLMSVGILWPLVARVQYEDVDSARRATRRLTRELRRLLLHGALRSETGPNSAESKGPRKSGA